MSSETAVTSAVEILEPAPTDTERKLVELVLDAITDRQTLKIRYHPREGRKFTVSDYAVIERNLDSFLRGILTAMGFKLPKGFRLRFNMETLKFTDDDADWLDLEVPFEKILGPKTEDKAAARPARKRRKSTKGKALVTALLALLAGTPLAAQEPEPPTWPPLVEEPAEEPEAVETEPVEPLPGLYLSAWCSLKRGADDAVATCDQGLAGALASWDPGEDGGLRTSWVLFGGAETVGTGGAISRRISDRVVLGLGAGVVIPIPDEGGLETDDLRLAVGVTASFW